MAVVSDVASDCHKAAIHGWVVLCGVECLDFREGRSGYVREGSTNEVVEVGFACVGEKGTLICDVSAY